MSTHNICFCGEIRKISILFGLKKSTLTSAIVKDIPKLSPFASWLSAMINIQYLQLPVCRMNFHGPKDV